MEGFVDRARWCRIDHENVIGCVDGSFMIADVVAVSGNLSLSVAP